MEESIITTHPATLAMLESAINEGATRCTYGTNGNDNPVKLEVFRHAKHGITAQIFVGLDDRNPTTISGLTMEQADALGWLICKLC